MAMKKNRKKNDRNKKPENEIIRSLINGNGMLPNVDNFAISRYQKILFHI